MTLNLLKLTIFVVNFILNFFFNAKKYNDPNDKTCATFIICDEDHTIANPLRYMIMKDFNVELCGYTIPHVSSYKVHLRIQTFPDYTAIEAFRRGLENLIEQSNFVLEEFKNKADEFETRCMKP